MSYANLDIIKLRIGSLYKSEGSPTGQITDNQIIAIITTADTTVKSKLRKEGLTPPADTADDIDELKEASNLLAIADILDTVYESTEGNRSPSATAKETQAYELITSYLNRPEEEEKKTANIPGIIGIGGDMITE